MSAADSNADDTHGTPDSTAAASSPQPTVRRVHADNGKLIVEEHLLDGQRHGSYRAWWDNGRPREEGRFHRGVRVGLYRWFGESGMLLKEEDYGPGVH